MNINKFVKYVRFGTGCLVLAKGNNGRCSHGAVLPYFNTAIEFQNGRGQVMTLVTFIHKTV